jgi:hypothetical protein
VGRFIFGMHTLKHHRTPQNEMNPIDGDDKLKEHLRDEIERTGFPLEIETYSILKSHNWIAFANDYYFDNEERKEREIDLYAIPMPEIDEKFNIKNPVDPFTLDVELAIECKKSDTHAWVFFTRPVDSGFFYSGQTLDYMQIRSNNYERSVFDKLIPPPDTGGLLHYGDFRRLASSYTTVKFHGDGSGRDDVFTASNQLVKFIAYSFQQRIERLKLYPRHRAMIFVIPVIVFDGKLYEATLGPRGKLILSRRQHILFERRSRLLHGIEAHRFLIDVVVREYFVEFLVKVQRDIQNIENSIIAQKKSLARVGRRKFSK